jgi:hypothetical protein
MFTFIQLQDEVKRGAIRNQAGTIFDDAIKNVINRVITRIAMEAPWRSLRRKEDFRTLTTYTTGTGTAFINVGSNVLTVTGADFWGDFREGADGIYVPGTVLPELRGRKVTIEGSNKKYTIINVQSSTRVWLDDVYDGNSNLSNGDYTVHGQENYVLPIGSSLRMFMWHEMYGYPYKMVYLTDQEFYEWSWGQTTHAVPTHYRMWGEDSLRQVNSSIASLLSVVSTNTGDTSIPITIHGKDSNGIPVSETINTDGGSGTTPVTGTQSFYTIDRISKGSSTLGQIDVYMDNGYTKVSRIPAGDYTAGIKYHKIQLYPIPDRSEPIHVQYYKEPLRLVNDSDIHELGGDFDQAIIYLSIAILKYENNMAEGDKFAALYKDEMRILRRINADKIDWLPRLRRPKDNTFPYGPMAAPYLSYRQVGPNYGPAINP